ncbi:hypothetical protein AVEN_230517-1 [Araneus ventricosus]|uniref:Uncharacterized protein n=1 Tax=Araneus ventricosus TaxID=182803 RepID=A0A4Y2SGR5_ARAVE|nr:hypothetical protein AVEN_230517-1 [Araneus ventricosus]
MMMIGPSVDYVRSGGMRNVPVTKAVEHLYATTPKFSECVHLASRTAHSYPPRQYEDDASGSSHRHDISPSTLQPRKCFMRCGETHVDIDFY